MAKFISLEEETQEQFIPLEEETSGGFISLEEPEPENFISLEEIDLALPPMIQTEVVVEPSSEFGDPAAIAAAAVPARSLPTKDELKYIGKEIKQTPVEVAKGGARFVESSVLGGIARLERMTGDIISSAIPTLEKVGVDIDKLSEDIFAGPTMDTINNIGEYLTKQGQEGSKYWTQAANTGWEAVKKNNETPVASFIGQTSEAAYSSAVMLGAAYLSGGSTLAAEAAALPLSSSATLLSAQTKAAIGTMSALSASNAWEETKDLGGTNLEALTQFSIDYMLEYFGETTAFGEVFQGQNVGVAKLTLNSMLEEGGVGFGQDFRSTFNISRLEGDSIEDSMTQALNVALSNLPQNTAGGALGAMTVNTVNRGVNRYKVAKYTNLMNSAKAADDAVRQLESTAEQVKENPAEAEAATTPVVHEMPDGTVMPGAAHPGSVPNSSVQVEDVETEAIVNPYLNTDFDIHRVLADAEHGVAAAQQAVMQRVDELQYFEEDYNRVLTGESKKPIKSTAAELGEVEPSKPSKPKSIKNIKIKGLEDDFGKKVLSNLRVISGNDNNFRKISYLANSLGGVPADPQMRDSFIRDLYNVAKTQKAFDKKSEKLKKKDKRSRIFNPWVESRYSLAQAEQITGRPFRRLYLNMIGKSNSASDEVSTGMLAALQEAGIKKGSIILNRQQADSVSDYLFEESEVEREKLYSKLDERSRNVVGVLDDLLQGPIANEIRQARWYKWNDQYKSDILKVAKAQIKAAKKGERISEETFDRLMSRSSELIPRNVVDSVTDFETVYNEDGSIDQTQTNRNRRNAATQVLKEGMIANEQGQLRDWISGQKWGTRAHYYMSEGRVSDLVDYVDSQTIREFEPSVPTKPGKLDPEISAAKERKGQAQKKGSRSVIRDVMQHWERAATFNAAHDDLVNFWDNFDSAIVEFGSDNINPKDVTNIRNLLNATIARPTQGSDLSAVTSKASNLFWTAYFADVSRAGRFAVRNLKQNMAYLSSQLSPVEMTKAVGRMATGKGTSAQELSNFEEFWKTEVSQKRQMFNHFIMSNEASQTEVLGHNLSRLTNSLGSLAMRSDEANRKVAWKMAYEISTHNLDLYNQGKIDYKTLESRLKINTLNTSERLELKGLLNTSESYIENNAEIQEEFIKRYTSMKTMNTHFGYDLKHKSMIEQNPGARQIIGPVTYFRGRSQIIRQSVVNPIIQAKQTGNWKQGREALGNLFKFIVGTALAHKAAEKMGYEAYDLVSDSVYTPLSPGVSLAVEASREIDYAISQAGDEVDFETSVIRIAEVIGGLGELGVPMLNTMSQLYQARNNVSGVTTMKRVQNLLYEQGWAETEKRYKDMDRNLFEKIGSVFWGGFEKPKKD